MADVESQQASPGAADTRLHRLLHRSPQDTNESNSRLHVPSLYHGLELRHIRQSLSSTSVTPPESGSTGKSSANEQRLFLEKLFALSDQRLQGLPGIFTYLHFVEQSFQPLLDHDSAVLARLMKEPDPSPPITFWRWAVAILDVIRSLDKADTSILNIYQSLISKASLTNIAFTAEEKNFLLICIFMTTCLTSLICTPQLSLDTIKNTVQHEQKLFATQTSSETPTVQPSDAARRPFSKMIGGFRRRAWDITNVTTAPSDDLHESTLNYYCLQTIGRVRIEWVSDLTKHLEFDRQRRCVCIFKYPSFCVATAIRQSSEKVFDNAFQEVFLSQDSDETNFQQPVAREVLLSYRLLFAQDRRSRSLIKDEIGNTKKKDEDMDPFLEQVCCQILDRSFRMSTKDFWPPSCQDFNDQLREQDVYSAREDFPIFGARLLRLQQYSLRQQPSRIRDLWRDRRNPLQWYTFWAVLWVGGLSLLMALLQLCVAVAQLVFQIIEN